MKTKDSYRPPSCPDCGGTGWATDSYGQEERCHCGSDGEFCAICETVHRRGIHCRLRRSLMLPKERVERAS